MTGKNATGNRAGGAALPEGGEFHNTVLSGCRVRYFTRLSGSEEPPLLLCNGLGQCIEMLFPLIQELGDRSVVVFDVPGVGRSEFNERIATIPQFTRLAAELMQSLGIERWDVLGISWGGTLAQQLAHSYPDKIRRIVLAITSAGGIGSWLGTPIALSEIFFPLRFTSKEYGNLIGPWMYGGDAVCHPEQFREYSKNAIAPTGSGYFTQVRAMCSWTSLPWLQRLKQPALVIAGRYDGLIPIANQILLANTIPDSELHVFSDGHLLMYTRRKQVAALITRFLA